MLGPDYLLSPVTQYQAKTWDVYLPKFEDAATSSVWVHHYTNRTYKGGKSYAIDVSDLDTFPLFKRSPAEYSV
jgi:alpha-D-xyloside xylohydrolase